MADYDKLLQVPRGTKARLEEIKLDLLVNTIVYATDTKELGIKLSDGNIEYFKNATDINAIVNTLDTSKQDKLVAGDNITIDETTNVISASGGSAEVDLDEMAYFDYAGRIYGSKYNLLLSAWEHSLTVDPLEISVDSTTSNKRGTAQYPNGTTEGVIIPQGVTSIGENAFSGWSSNNQPLIIPNGVTTIGNYAFYNWSSNNQPLIIPNGVTTIGSEAFYYWTSNNQPLIIPNSVTTIGNYAFYNWSSNNQPLTIPSSVTEIGYNAFYNWSSAKEFIMESETPPTIDYYSFYYTNNAPFYVPDNSVEAYKTATNWSAMARRIFPMSDRVSDSGGITTSEMTISVADIFAYTPKISNITVAYNYIGDDPANFTVDFSNFALGEDLILEIPDLGEGEIPANMAVAAIFDKTTLNYFEIIIMFRYIILGTLTGMIKTSSNSRIRSILDLYTDDYWKSLFSSNPFSNVFEGINFVNMNLDDGGFFLETFTVDFMMFSEDAPYFDATGSGSNINVVVETKEDEAFSGELTVDEMELKFFPDIRMKPNYNSGINTKQDKLIAGNNITINPITNVISASGGAGGGDGIDLDTIMYVNYASDIFNKGGNQSLLPDAWRDMKNSETVLFDIPLTLAAPNQEIAGMTVDLYAGADEQLQALYDACASGAIRPPYSDYDRDISIQDTYYVNNTATIYMGDMSGSASLPIPLYAFGAFGMEDGNNSFVIGDLTPLEMGLGLVLGKIANDSIPNNNIVIQKGFEFENENGSGSGIIIPNSVTSIDYGAFLYWLSNNQPLVIPNSVTSIGDIAFGVWLSNNQPLVIPNSVTSIGERAFMSWTANNQPLVIPNSVTSIGDYAFGNWSSAKAFIMESETPPTITYDSFYNTNNAPFYVPDDSVAAYKTATNWSNLANRIFPMSDMPQEDGGTVDWKDVKNKPELQDKLTAGNNITIDPVTNVISASGGGGGGDYELTKSKIDTALSGPESGSIQLGLNATAERTGSIALGQNASASGTSSTALGHGASASGLESIALGSGASTSLSRSMALGKGATVVGSNSIAIGTGTVVTEDNVVDFGSARQVRVKLTPVNDRDAVSKSYFEANLFSKNYNDLTNKPNLKTVATSGSYNDLINKPELFSKNYSDLTNKPELFSKDYSDLTNKPNIPDKTSDLINDSDFTTKDYVDDKTTIKEQNKNTVIKFWTGSYTEYTSLSVKDENTLYFIEEE